ncbi:MAG: MlaD family protein [Planctomycetota bacterium]|jgi:phospholipid/cholesterol/gamma-HCH transport system substrate-binding protein
MHPKHAFLVGLTSILALLILAGLLMVFGEFDRLLMPSYRLQVMTDNAAGLRPGSSVAMNGVRIGQVDTIELRNGGAFPIRVTALIEQEQPIPEDTTFEIDQPLLGGSSILSLIGDLSSDRHLPTDGTAQISGAYRSMLDRLNDALAGRFTPLMEAMDSISGLSTTLHDVAADFRQLTEPQSESAIEAGQVPNLRTAISRLSTMLDQATTTLREADEWLGDETLREDMRESIRRAGAAFDEAAGTMQRYAKLADSLEADTDRLLTDMRPVLDQVSLTLEQIQQVATTAARGDGTVAQLLNNPDLYRSLEDASVRLERVLSELQLLIQKIKAEGLPIDL